MKQICVIGTGYVGLVNATCFADLGNNVVTVDIDEAKIAKLKRGEMPIYEPGLEELVERNVKAGRLSFTTSYEEGLKDAEFVFVCVGTPSAVDGEADLKYVRAAAQTIAQTMKKPLIIINKSTVPVGTGDWTTEIISKSQPQPIPFAVVSCPEFLREGVAIQDFMKPDRTVLGSTDREAAQKVAALYEPLGAPIQITDLRTAEMIKYASNAFLATRISFINEISIICERLGADVTEVAKGMGYDKRIGPHFLQAGTGYGGSCFTSDETLFTLNSPNVVAERIADSFQRAVGTVSQDGEVEVKYPNDKRVLGFDVQTGQPTITRVKALTKRPYQGMMVTIKTSMGRELRVTADHPVLIHDGQAFQLLPAIHVAPGDRVATLMLLPQGITLQVSPTVGALSVSSSPAAHGGIDTLEPLFVAQTQAEAAEAALILQTQQGIIPSFSHDALTGLRYVHESQEGFQRHEGYAILTVQDVEYFPVDTEVYSLETEVGVIVGSYGMIQKQCFPKDVKALANMALTHGMHPQLLNAVMEINDFQRKHIVIKVRELVGGTFEGKVIGVLGLAFKENTDDVRESPALTVVRQMMNGGAKVRAYDPVAMENAIKEAPGMILCQDPYEVAEGVDCMVIMTPWNEFKQLDMARILRAQRHPNLVDGRNLYDPATMRQVGFTYRGVGRGYNGEGHHDEDEA
jgi:UDP-glucose 6-dehydrogenase